MNIKKSILLRVRAAFLLVCIIPCGILYRMFFLQHVEGDYWRSKYNSFTKGAIKATRGNIYSDNGSLLATSIPQYRLTFDATAPKDEVFKKGLDSLAYLLSNKLKIHESAYYKRLISDSRKNKKRYIFLTRGYSLKYEDKKEMEKWPLFRLGRNKGGVIFEKTYKRYKPFKDLAMRTVGFINENKQGVGLERSFNKQLAGTDGSATFQKLSGGQFRPIFDGTEVRPIEGLDIYTTIDVNIQDVAEASLLSALKRHNAEYGCVALMEVKTGHIKAIANLSLENGQYVEKFNHVIGQNADAGSTFKLASFMSLLEDKLIQPTDIVDTKNGEWKLDRKNSIFDVTEGGYGKITIQEAFEKSSNVATCALIDKHYRRKPEKYIENLARFGLTENLHFQILGSQTPYIKSPLDVENWYGSTLPSMSIGYEMKMSPLNMLAFYNAVANEGKMIQPIIVKEVKKFDKVVEKYETTVLREKICSEETRAALLNMLIGVVERGTAKKIKDPNYAIAGKTGTARKLMDNGVYSRSEFSTSFIGFFPADKPRYSAIVVIDKPRGVYQYAGDVAAPVFKDVANKVFSIDPAMHKLLDENKIQSLELPETIAGHVQELQKTCNALGISNHLTNPADEWVVSKKSNKAIVWKNVDEAKKKVPDVRGMSLKDALYLLESKGYLVKTEGRGRVKSQLPNASTVLEKGNIINIKLG